MSFKEKHSELRPYEAPECSCFGLSAAGGFLTGSPFGVTETENYATPEDANDNWF